MAEEPQAVATSSAGNSARIRGRAQLDRIRDARFRRQVQTVLGLHEFIFCESIKIPETYTQVGEFIDHLYALQICGAYGRGRRASGEDWRTVGQVSAALYALLDSSQRKRFQLRLSTGMLMLMPLALISIAMLCLGAAVFPDRLSSALSIAPEALRFSAFLVWLVCMGSMGSIAFIYVNALAIQVDPTVDLSNRAFMVMRVILGALFSLILTMPFGFSHFDAFMTGLFASKPDDPSQGLILIIPFVLGFSTPLVLAVMNRMIEGVQTFFGVNVQKLPHAPDPAAMLDLKAPPNSNPGPAPEGGGDAGKSQ